MPAKDVEGSGTITFTTYSFSMGLNCIEKLSVHHGRDPNEALNKTEMLMEDK